MVEDNGEQLRELTPAQRKLFELRMKVNAGRKANKQVRPLRSTTGLMHRWRRWHEGVASSERNWVLMLFRSTCCDCRK